MKPISQFRLFFVTLVVITLFAATINSQGISGVDPTFYAVPSKPLVASDGSSSDVGQAVQADGKILIWGPPLAVSGLAKGRLARLNSDGSLDLGFTYCHCVLETFSNALPLPDGKILVGGSALGVMKVIRLNNDGSLDPTFNSAVASGGGGFSTATIAAVQSDGRFFITRSWSQSGFGGTDLFHYNADGSLDSGFNPVPIGFGSPNFSYLGDIKVLPDGRFYLAINTSAPFNISTVLKRYTAAGSPDPTWTEPSIGGSSGLAKTINGIDVQADEKVVVVGNFETVNGVPRVDIVRLLPAGNVDLNFSAPVFNSASGVRVLSSGKILYSAVTDNSGVYRLFRLNPNGSLDNTYVMDPDVTTIRNEWVLDASERAIFLGPNRLVRLLADGPRDISFEPNVSRFGSVHAIARMSDGMIVIAGDFSGFNGVPAAGIVRTEPDGSIDLTFNPGTGFNSIPARLFAQPDGKVIAIGDFSSYNGSPAPGIVRLMPDGSADPQFNVTPNQNGTINWVEILADGRMYLGGSFSSINGVARPGVMRISADGTPDQSFNALIGGSPTITAVRVQADENVLIGGSFTGVGGFNRSNFARVDPSGALDQSFNPTNTVAGRIYPIAKGKIYTTSASQLDSHTILRRNSDGSIDSTFTSPEFRNTSSSGTTRIESLVVMADGSLVVGGWFNRVAEASRTGIARLAPNGRLDVLFMPQSTDGRVRTLIGGGGNKVLMGGDFTRIENSVRAGIARLIIEPYRKTTLFDFDGDGRADVSVYRPSTNRWYVLNSGNLTVSEIDFGLSGDIPTPQDWDSDGKTDPAIFRPSTGTWWYRSSISGSQLATQFGAAGDIPRPGDYNGDGRIDYVVYRPSELRWYLNTGTIQQIQFGGPGDKAVSGDFDRDGKNDLAIFRPSTGTWWYASSANGGQHRAVQWGIAEDIPAPADYDGDGFTDLAVYRPSTRIWYIWNSSNGTNTIVNFGLSEDRPVPADYDGDGRADIAVYRPSTGVWYLLQSTSGFTAYQFGISTDVALPGSFVP